MYICDDDIANNALFAVIDEPKDDAGKYIVMSNGMTKVLYIENILQLSKEDIVKKIYINGGVAQITSSEFQKVTNAYCIFLMERYKKTITTTAINNFDSQEQVLLDISLPKKLIRTLQWNIKKKELKFDGKKLLPKVMKNCVYFAHMGNNIGSEIEKLRPVLIWKQHINEKNHETDSYYVFPISSRVPSREYYFNVKFEVNGETNIIKVNDGKRISIKRFEKPLVDIENKRTFKINEETREKIKIALVEYFG